MYKSKRKIVFLSCLISVTFGFSQTIDNELPSWKKGMMDIHHINTGRGDASFLVFPDGTTMLVDAGDTSETHPRTQSARSAAKKPNGSKSAPGWIIDYVHQFFPKEADKQLDFALITHYHDDHFGEVDPHREKAKDGDYQLTGITEVGHFIPIHTLLDRGSEFPLDLKNPQVQQQLALDDEYQMIPTLKNYWKFIERSGQKYGLVNKALKAGVSDQIKLLNSPENYPNFTVRNIAVNGNIWTGVNDHHFSLYEKGDDPGENPLSACIKITYGKFDYFTGGDISGVNDFGGTDLNTVESHIAPVVGPVDVATLNHHGNRDSQNAYYVKTIRPRVWIQQNWSSDHPGGEVLRRITSTSLYPGERDIFSTTMLQANKDVIGSRLDTYKSQNGHIVVRVYNNGTTYTIYVHNDASEKREVLAVYGPYESR